MEYKMQQWLETVSPHDFWQIQTNRDIINSPDKPEGWFNPFTEPDKLLEELKQFRTGRETREYLEKWYPGIDAERYAQKRIDANKAREIKYCSTSWKRKWNPQKQKFIYTPKRCKHWNDCPRCREWKLEQNRMRLDNVWAYRVVTVEDESMLEKGSKSNYLRIPRNDGTVTFILKGTPQNDNEKMTKDLYELLAEDMLPNEARGRFSGNLGKKAVVVKEETEDKPSVQVNNFLIRFTDKSKIKDNKALDEILMPRIVSAILPLQKDARNLQAITDIAERILDRVCIEYKVEKQFLYTETIFINVDSIEWLDGKELLKMRE